MNNGVDNLNNVVDNLNNVVDDFKNAVDKFSQIAISLNDLPITLKKYIVRCDETFDATNRILKWIEENHKQDRLEVCLDELSQTTASFEKLDKEENVSIFMRF